MILKCRGGMVVVVRPRHLERRECAQGRNIERMSVIFSNDGGVPAVESKAQSTFETQSLCIEVIDLFFVRLQRIEHVDMVLCDHRRLEESREIGLAIDTSRIVGSDNEVVFVFGIVGLLEGNIEVRKYSYSQIMKRPAKAAKSGTRLLLLLLVTDL